MDIPAVLFRLFKKIAFTFLLLFVFFAGIVAGNLDRLDAEVFSLLQYQEFLPRQWQRFLPGGRAGEGRSHSGEELSGRIIKVADGDTATLLSQDGTRKYKIRFFGMDAPESSQEFGRESGNALKEKILGEKVKVLVVNIDRYGRSVGKVYKEERYINQEMIAGGFAWYYRDYAKNEKDLEKAGEDARRNRLGLWQNPLPPQPPWQYRKNQKGEKESDRQKAPSSSLFSIFR